MRSLLLCLAMGAITASAYATDLDFSFATRFEISDCFQSGPDSAVTCLSQNPDYQDFRIALHPNTVPNPYNSSGWEGKWEQTLTFKGEKYFASVEVFAVQAGTTFQYRIRSRLWKDLIRAVAQEILVSDPARIPETMLFGPFDPIADHDFLQPRLGLRFASGGGQ